ncbi:MAG: phosphotransferase enzyme family protein [Trebonia sp.]
MPGVPGKGTAGRDDLEVPLAGGNVSASVVRVGATVRKPASPSSAAVEALLKHLESVGFDGAPRALGRDERGRVVLEFVPGRMADAMPPMTERELRRAGRLIRDYHDAAAGFVPPAGAAWQVPIPADRDELICHHDLAPWNLVRGVSDDGAERWVFIDWDGAGPGSRLWDLGYAAHGFVPMAPDRDPGAAAPRLRAFADGYGLDERQRGALPELIAGHTRGMYELLKRGSRTGEQPWARLWTEGHGDYWGAAASYIGKHLETWRKALLA